MEDTNKTPRMASTVANALIKYSNAVSDIFSYKRLRDTTDASASVVSYKKRKDDWFEMPTDSRFLKIDLINAKVNIVTLEHKIKCLEQEQLKMQILSDAKIKKLEEHSWWDKIKIRELNNNLTKAQEQESEVREQLMNIQHKYDVLRSSSDVNIERLENQIANLKADFRFDKNEKLEELRKYKQKVIELQEALKVSADIEASQKTYTENLEKQVAAKNEVSRNLELKALELYNARLDLKALQYLKENYEEYQMQIKTHEKKLYGYNVLEKENIQLKEDVARLRELIYGKLLLEEQVHDLTNKLKRFKAQEVELEELKVKEGKLVISLGEWQAVANGLCGTSVPYEKLPHALRCAVEALQKQEISLTAEKIHLVSNLNTTIHESQLLATDLDTTRKQFVEVQRNCQESQNLIQRLQNKLTIVCAERENYRLLLESYDRQDTSQSENMETENADKEIIKNLTNIVEGYRTTLSKLENDMRKLKPLESGQTLANKIIKLEAEVGHLKADNRYLQQRRDTLEIHLEKLAKIGLELDYTQNEDYRHLKRQVDCLRDQVGNKDAEISNMKIEHEKEIAKMKHQPEPAFTTNQVDKPAEDSKMTIQRFINIVYILFGYKLEFDNGDQYTLTSIFSPGGEDRQLCFQIGSGDMVNLLENKYSLSLGPLIDLHLRQYKSIPTFLSTITLDLFSKDRLAGSDIVEIDDDSSDSVAASDTSKISIDDNSDKSSECSSKNSCSPRSKSSDSADDSSDE